MRFNFHNNGEDLFRSYVAGTRAAATGEVYRSRRGSIRIGEQQIPDTNR